MISMRYAWNLVHGNGLIWNPGGERVEGYSNFLWVLVMSVIHFLPLPSTLASLPVLILNMVLAVMVLVLSARLIKFLHPEALLVLPFMLSALMLCYDIARWTIIGLETILQTVIILWLLMRMLEEAKVNSPRPLTFLMAGMLGIVRVDGIVLGGILCLLGLILNPSHWKKIILLSLLIFIAPLANILFRVVYYGTPLPNTYYLKLTGWSLGARLLPGIRYIAHFLFSYGVIAGVAIAGAVVSRNRRVVTLLISGIPLIFYAIYVGGDDFGGARLLAPWVPVLIIVAFSTPHVLGWDKLPVTYILSQGVLLVSVVLMAGFNFFSRLSYEAPYVHVGLILQKLTFPETRIAVFPAGALPYFAERPAVDMLGKNDAGISHLQAQPGMNKPGHNKFDFNYSLGQLQPDIVVSTLNPTDIGDPKTIAQYTQGDNSYQGKLYLDPTFQTQYAGSLIFIENIPLYIRDNSPERVRLMTGRCKRVSDQNLVKLGFNIYCWPLLSEQP